MLLISIDRPRHIEFLVKNLYFFILGQLSFQDGDVGAPGQFFSNPLVSLWFISHNPNDSIVMVAGNLLQELPLDCMVRRGYD
jgi:hypothetical protein